MEMMGQRELLTTLGFIEEEIPLMVQKIKEHFGEKYSSSNPTFLEQKKLPSPFNWGIGVSAVTLDGSLWGRHTELSGDERMRLREAGFKNQTDLVLATLSTKQ